MNEQFLSIYQPTDTLSLVNIIHINRLYKHFHKIVVEIFRPNLLPKKNNNDSIMNHTSLLHPVADKSNRVSIIFTQHKHFKKCPSNDSSSSLFNINQILLFRKFIGDHITIKKCHYLRYRMPLCVALHGSKKVH